MSSYGVVMIDVYNGQLRARKWPNKRGPNRSATNQYWSEWMRQAMALAHYATPKEIWLNKQAVRNLPVKYTDLYLQAMRGTLWAIELPDGTIVWPIHARDKVASSLDLITNLPGGMLARDNLGWDGVAPAAGDGYLLSSVAGGIPIWLSREDADIGPISQGITVKRTTSQTIAVNTSTAVTWPVVQDDTSSPPFWVTGQQTRLTANHTGWYLMIAFIEWNSQSWTFAATDFRVNGTDFRNAVTDTNPAATAFQVHQNVSECMYLNSGDYVEVVVFQTASIQRAITRCEFGMQSLT